MRASMGKTGSFFAIFLCLALLGFTPAFGQQGKYTLYELATLGGPNTYAYDINDAGQVVGMGDTNLYREGRVWQAFSGTKEGISPLFPGEDARSSANAINRDGTIAGYKNGSAFVAGGGIPFSDLGILPGASASWGLSINSGKKVAGYSWSEGVSEKAAFWEKDGLGIYLKSDLGTLGGLYTRATGVNDSDQVTGYSQNLEGANRAFRWQRIAGNDPLTDLGVLAEFTDSFGVRINSKGEVTGYSLRYDEFYVPTARACLWMGNSIRELKKKNASGISESVSYSEAYGINDSAVVVGTYLEGADYRAFIWDGVNEMRDLNSLIPENSGLLLVAAYAINNRGEIVGYGYKSGSAYATAFLLVPPPVVEPAEEPFQVGIDIRPWNAQNTINMRAMWGLIPVAILSAEGFNAPQDVDRESLTFGQKGDERSLAFCTPWKWDVNHDRRKDLICYFHERLTAFTCEDTAGTLNGNTHDDVSFRATDKVQIVPCPPARKHHHKR